MKIEAFSASRDPDRPDANEDCLVVLPGRGLAVVDGVTDRTGARFGGATSGRLAARAVAAAFAAFVAAPGDANPARLVDALSAALRDLYRQHGLLDVACADPARRFGATIAAAIERPESWRFVRVGDSGIRLDARELLLDETKTDRVTAALRRAVDAHLAAGGADAATRARVAHACVLHGLAAVPTDAAAWIDEAARARLRAASLADAKARVPEADGASLEALVDGGVVKGQSRHANAATGPFGYGVLDGFDVPAAFVHVDERPRVGLRTIELFTDGYFKVPDAASLAAWEAAADEVERVDPAKLGAYAAPKGSLGRLRADDRTVIVATL
jgi:hypothetical protein